MTRVFVSGRVLGVLLSAALSLVGVSRAIAGTTFISPFDGSPCASPFDVIDDLNDPNFIYNNAPLKECIALCRKAANDCREQVRIAAGCEQSMVGNQAVYDAATCDIQNSDATARRTCRVSHALDRGTQRDSIRSDRDEALADCQMWLTTCVNTCGVL
ncbi:MAG TPA: hypothetical protein VMR50_04560 [Myxococcota bacterium]|nr:hypothetical protein [Myxococcota bacterium]